MSSSLSGAQARPTPHHRLLTPSSATSASSSPLPPPSPPLPLHHPFSTITSRRLRGGQLGAAGDDRRGDRPATRGARAHHGPRRGRRARGRVGPLACHCGAAEPDSGGRRAPRDALAQLVAVAPLVAVVCAFVLPVRIVLLDTVSSGRRVRVLCSDVQTTAREFIYRDFGLQSLFIPLH